MRIEKLSIEQGISENIIEDLLDFSYPYFSNVMSKEYYKEYIINVTNFKKSLLLYNDDKIIGIYFLGSTQITQYSNDKRFKNLKGVEGVMLLVTDEYRGKGFGDKLKDYPKTMGYDYIWGQQAKILSNLSDWLKRRELILETTTIYITAELF
jgi:GNAT superfamily N-acetyltransferase